MHAIESNVHKASQTIRELRSILCLVGRLSAAQVVASYSELQLECYLLLSQADDRSKAHIPTEPTDTQLDNISGSPVEQQSKRSNWYVLNRQQLLLLWQFSSLESRHLLNWIQVTFCTELRVQHHKNVADLCEQCCMEAYVRPLSVKSLIYKILRPLFPKTLICTNASKSDKALCYAIGLHGVYCTRWAKKQRYYRARQIYKNISTLSVSGDNQPVA